MTSMTRQDLKRNELGALFEKGLAWVQANRQTFFSSAGIVVGAVLFSVFFIARLHTAAKRADDKLAIAQGLVFTGQTAPGISALDELLVQYGSTAAAAKARLLKADLFISRSDYAAAEPLAQEVIRTGKPPAIVPLAFAQLAAVQENAGKPAEAMATLRTFLEKYPDHFLVPSAIASLGRMAAASGDLQEAMLQYEKLLNIAPDSPWSQRAQERLASLRATSQKGFTGRRTITKGGTL